MKLDEFILLLKGGLKRCEGTYKDPDNEDWQVTAYWIGERMRIDLVRK